MNPLQKLGGKIWPINCNKVCDWAIKKHVLYYRAPVAKGR